MEKKSRLIILLVTLVLMLGWMPVQVFANSPEPTPFYTFYLTNLPEGAEYVDLLIRLPETDEMYVALNSGNIPDQFAQDAQILSYCEDDYRSYTYHYRDALSMIRILGKGYVRYFTDSETSWNETHIRFDHAREIINRGRVKLAILDARGGILQISRPLDLNAVNKFSYNLGEFYYDCATGDFSAEAIEDNMLKPFSRYVVSAVFGVLLTCLLELMTELLFELKTYRCLIAWTNVASQILMRITYVLLYLYTPLGYGTITLLLEGLVYLGEFLWYCHKMKDVPRKKVLGFTVTANSVSWILGHIINLIAFFGMFIMI